MTSIVLTYHEEGLDFLMECLCQIRETIDIRDYEIIVVDDCSAEPLPYIKGVGIVRNEKNIGVGASFDVGIRHASGENIFFGACDMRFINNGWASKLLKSIENNPKSLICTTCVYLNNTEMDMKKRIAGGKLAYGANLLVYWDKETDPANAHGRSILEAKWKEQEDNTTYEIPVILGAFYGAKKSWYEYIDGFWGHRKWGSLEPYISIKSWLFGGNCLINPNIFTGHIFKDPRDKEGKLISYHNTKAEQVFFNKALIANLFFDNPDKLIDFVDNKITMANSVAALEEIREEVDAKRIEYKNKTIFSLREYADKFNIDLRDAQNR